MQNIQAALSGIRASQIGLNVTANNIANADNPNHHRQSVQLASVSAYSIHGFQIGTGVTVDHVRRTFNTLVEESLTQNLSELNSVDQQLSVFKQIESVLSPGAGSIQSHLEALFNEFTNLTSNPADPVRRTTVLQRAESLTEELNSVANKLIQLSSAVNQRINSEVDTANKKLAELADLNRRVEVETQLGRDPHQLLDIRDKVINELAEIVDVQQHKQTDAPFNLLAANRGIFVGETPPKLSTALDEEGITRVYVSGRNEPLTFGGGRLQALQELTSTELPRVQQQINDFAAQLSSTFDKIQSTGIPISGPHTLLRGSRSLSSSTVPFNQADPAFPTKAGPLNISITNLSTGKQSIATINFDPETMSLNDVAAAISGIDHLQAVTNDDSQLAIVAETGYAFDFGSRVETDIDTSGVSGTTEIELSGVYTGAENDQFTYEIVGSGTVGVTDGLRLQVKNLNGTQVADIDIGSSYSPGTSIDVIDGVQVKLASGTVVDGETFTSSVIADADIGNLLVALGLGTFFTGDSAANLAVNEELLNNSDALATSRSGDSGDSGNVLRFLEQRTTELSALSGRTLESFVDDTIRETATNVQLLSAESGDLDVLRGRLETERAAAIGVDPNEELVKLMQYQKSFEMSARIVTVADENLQTLLRLVG